MELVSVIIPCYNSGYTIEKTISSVKDQSWKNIEIIVVDDGSNIKTTTSVLNSLGDDVILLKQKNLGLPAARNAGIKLAKGDYILPLDADDWIDPEMISRLMNELYLNKNARYAYCDICLEGDSSGILSRSYNFFEQLFINQLPYCILFKKDLWVEMGGYDETLKKGYEDWEFNIRMGCYGYYPIHLNQALFHYRVSKTGMLISKSNRLHGQIWLLIQNKNIKVYSLRSLVKIWYAWRRKPSRSPLLFYFILYLIHKVTPGKLFSIFFKVTRAFKKHWSLG